MIPGNFEGNDDAPTMADPAERDTALSNLDTIRTVMVRATRYTHISVVGILLGGAAASTAALLGRVLGISPVEKPLAFLALWTAAFGPAILLGFLTSARKARQSGEAFWNRKLQLVALGFFPAPLLGLVLTALLYDIGKLDLAPGVWAGLYGVGILSVAAFLDWEFQLTAWSFLVASAAALFLLRSQPHLSLFISFGGIHLALGVYRLIKEYQWQRARVSPSFNS